MPTKEIPGDARVRIAQLLPTLSSNHQGEVAATAAAIARVLKGAGCDWHDLAKSILDGASITQRAQAEMAKRPPPQHRDQMRPGRGFGDGEEGIRRPRPPRPPRRPFEDESQYAARTSAEFKSRRGQRPVIKGQVYAHELQAAIDDIERIQGGYLDGLGERVFTFLEQLRDRCSKYDAVRISAKQDRWLRAIARDNGVNIPWDEIEESEAA